MHNYHCHPNLKTKPSALETNTVLSAQQSGMAFVTLHYLK